MDLCLKIHTTFGMNDAEITKNVNDWLKLNSKVKIEYIDLSFRKGGGRNVNIIYKDKC